MNQYQTYDNLTPSTAAATPAGQSSASGGQMIATSTTTSVTPPAATASVASNSTTPTTAASPQVQVPPGMGNLMAAQMGGGTTAHAQYQSQRKFDFEKKLMEELIDFQKENYKLARDGADNVTNIVEYQSYIVEKMRSMLNLQRFYFLYYPVLKLILLLVLTYMSFSFMKDLDINTLIQSSVNSAVNSSISTSIPVNNSESGSHDTGGGLGDVFNSLLEKLDPKQIEDLSIMDGAKNIANSSDAANAVGNSGPGVSRTGSPGN